jgi:subtilisin family serine protease
VIQLYSDRPPVPLPKAIVSFEDSNGSNLPQTVTDKNGIADITIPQPSRDVEIIIDAPDHETLVLKHTRKSYRITVPKLPRPNSHIGWWHLLCGIKSYHTHSGRGIRVGIIDSGFARLPAIAHCKDMGTVTVRGVRRRSAGDKRNHGTGVACLIGGRPTSPSEYAGLSPAVELYGVKVVPDNSPDEIDKNQRSIADALDILMEESVHLINCSFAFAEPSETVEHFLEATCRKGILCICAAGNSGGYTAYPASSNLTVSVAAFGDRKRALPNTPAALSMPSRTSTGRWDGDYFVPYFSCPGQCIAPGVAVVAPDPAHHGQAAGNKAKSGTSYATPIVAGLLATVLAQDSTYLAMPQNRARFDFALQKLTGLCQPFGFSRELQGAGRPVRPSD